MDQVSLLKCADYDLALVQKVLKKSFENIGGLEKYIKAGDKVLLKANLLMKKRPDEAVTTHPVVVEALVNMIHAMGGIVTIADSPGGPYNIGTLRGVYKACGMEDVANRTGAKLNYNTQYKNVSVKDAKKVKHFNIISPILEADVIINLPKLKTHMMTFYSGGVKNMFGAVPGLFKAEYHALYPDRGDFCAMLVDLCTCTKPTLTVMDAIWGMEGQGPSGGIPRKFGAILVSDSPYALDGVATAIVGITPQEAQTVVESLERGLWGGLDATQIIGERIEALKIHDLIKPPISDMEFGHAKWFLKPFANNIKKILVPKPVFDDKICIGCGDCIRSCPVNALRFKNKRPILNRRKCISCFCCQELCPKKAVEAASGGLVGRINQLLK